MKHILKIVKLIDRKAGLFKDCRKCLWFQCPPGVERHSRHAAGFVADTCMASAGAHDNETGSKQFAQDHPGRDSRESRHSSVLARERNLDSLQSRPDIALWYLDTLFGKVFEAKLDCIAGVGKSLVEGVALGDHARERRNDDGEPALSVRFKNDRKAAILRHIFSLAPVPQKNPSSSMGPHAYARGNGPRTCGVPLIGTASTESLSLAMGFSAGKNRFMAFLIPVPEGVPGSNDNTFSTVKREPLRKLLEKSGLSNERAVAVPCEEHR